MIEVHKKQKSLEKRTGGILQDDEQRREIEEEEGTFLDTLMEDDNVEAYDLLDFDF